MQNAILQQMRPNADIGGTKKPNVHISITVTLKALKAHRVGYDVFSYKGYRYCQ